MMKTTLSILISVTLLAFLTGCESKAPAAAAPPAAAETKPASYAIYAEFARDSNKLMKGGLNRRIFNVTEAHAGSDIALANDGVVTLLPGTYRISGFSSVTMQATFAQPKMLHNNNYPGYCLLYPKAFETDKEILKHTISIGSPQTAYSTTPSLFDTIYTVTEKTEIALGHQSGEDLHDEVYLSVYDVEGAKSDYHVFARIEITKL